jgi:hypothetical protein
LPKSRAASPYFAPHREDSFIGADGNHSNVAFATFDPHSFKESEACKPL